MKTKIKWSEIEKSCFYIADRLKIIRPDIIVAISRGGLIPSRLVSKYLNIRRIYSLGIESYSDKTNKASKIHTYQSFNKKFPPHNCIAIIDDIIDSGNSLKFAIDKVTNNIIKGNSISIVTCSIHYKDCSIIKPDIFHKAVNKDNWIIYPWE